MKRKCCVLGVTYVVLSLAGRSLAQVPKLMTCQGNLKVFASNGASYTEFNANHAGFMAYSSQAFAFVIGTDPKRPYLHFTPWLGIQHSIFPAHYKNQLLIDVDTDAESYINVRITGPRSGVRRHLNCSVGIDDRHPASDLKSLPKTANRAKDPGNKSHKSRTRAVQSSSNQD